MTVQELIARIQDDDADIEVVFNEMVEFFKRASNEELMLFLQKSRTDIDVDKYSERMDRIGELGSKSETFQKQMIRMFNFAEKNGINLGGHT